jgi:hypothetical protein
VRRSRVGGKLCGIATEEDDDIEERFAQESRDDESVAAVVSRAGENEHGPPRSLPSYGRSCAAAAPARSISGMPAAAASIRRSSSTR